MHDRDGRGVTAHDIDVQPRGSMNDPDHYWIGWAYLRDGMVIARNGRADNAPIRRGPDNAREEILKALSPDEWAGWLNTLSRICRAWNYTWWKDPANGDPLNRNKGELLALIHSEVSECLEGVRKNLMDDHLPHRRMEEVELADALIRIFDYAGGFGLDIGGAFAEKMKYNSERADHKPENRVADGGKAF